MDGVESDAKARKQPWPECLAVRPMHREGATAACRKCPSRWALDVLSNAAGHTVDSSLYSDPEGFERMARVLDPDKKRADHFQKLANPQIISVL
jgi:hypothetical protein